MTRRSPRQSGLARARQKAGLTQVDAAAHFGISPRTLQSYEKDPGSVSIRMLTKLAEFYGATLDDVRVPRPPQALRSLESSADTDCPGEEDPGMASPSSSGPVIEGPPSHPKHLVEDEPSGPQPGVPESGEAHGPSQPPGSPESEDSAQNRSRSPESAPRAKMENARENGFWADLRQSLLVRIPSRVPAQGAQDVVQEVLVKLIAECKQCALSGCPANCPLRELGAKIIRNVATGHLRKLSRREKTLPSNLSAPGAGVDDDEPEEPAIIAEFVADLQELKPRIEPILPPLQAQVMNVILGGLRSPEAIASALDCDLKTAKKNIRCLWRRVEMYRSTGNRRPSRRC